jgi:hypothetical protein
MINEVILPAIQVIAAVLALILLFPLKKKYKNLNETDSATNHSSAIVEILNYSFFFNTGLFWLIILIVANLLERVIKNWPLF